MKSFVACCAAKTALTALQRPTTSSNYLVCRTDRSCAFNVRISKSRGGRNEGKVVVQKYQPQHHCRQPSATAVTVTEMAPGGSGVPLITEKLDQYSQDDGMQ